MKVKLKFIFLISSIFCSMFIFGVPAIAQDDYLEDVFEEETEEEVTEYKPPPKREALTPEQFIKIQRENSAFLLDVRGKAELKYGVIANTVNIPLYVLDTEHTKLPRDENIVIFCDNGMRALFAYDLLYAKGFRKLKFLNYSVKFSKSGEYEIITYPSKK